MVTAVDEPWSPDVAALEAARAAARERLWSALETVGALDGSNDPDRDRAYLDGSIAWALDPLTATAHALLAAVRERDALRAGVRDLAEEMAEASQLRPTHGEFDRGVAAHQRDAADRLRALLAAVDGGQ